MPILPPAPDPLFSQRSLTTLLRDQIHKMENTVDELSDDLFLQNSPDDLVQAIAADAYLPPLQLGEPVSQIPTEFRNTVIFPMRVPADGFIYSVEVPYTGASGLLNHQPDTHDLEKPTVARIDSRNMQGSVLIRRAAIGDVTTEELRASFDAEIAKINKYIGYQAIQIDPFNASLEQEARRIVNGRRTRLLNARHLAASLGYPLRHREGAPLTFVSPIVRRVPAIVRTPSGTFRPEPTIAEAEYQNILRIIENMSFVMERNPRVFSVAPEETIRDHYLVQLNGQYEGTATGETFNGAGHTDIIVRDDNVNLFVAECKIWHGQKEFAEAIDQLLSYVTWRDTKTALIIFSRNVDTGAVVQNAITALQQHPNYKRDARMEGETRIRAVFGKPGDHSRDIILTVLVVAIPRAVN
ncbi:hypothetical protein [Rhodopseudomonas sp.]|uniref:hypothetical protein n=1 Tax=Rhodopseudomonas sp. TaxID=1078 RepID=UPI0039E67EC6